MHRYRYENDPAEREPLDNSYSNSSLYHHPDQSHQQHQQQQWQPQQQPQQQQYYDPPPQHSSDHHLQNQQDHYNSSAARQNNPSSSPPRAARGALRPGAHPDSAFNRLRAERRLSRDQQAVGASQAPYLTTGAAAAAAAQGGSPPRPELVSPISPPLPQAAHFGDDGRPWGQQESSAYRRPPPMDPHGASNVTPGSDNFSDSAAGGMAGIAYQVAERNARESGLNAIRGADPAPNSRRQSYAGADSSQQSQYPQYPPQQQYGPPQGGLRPVAYGAPGGDRSSHSSLAGLSAAAMPIGNASPGHYTATSTPHSHPSDVYTDDPYQGYSRSNHPPLGVVDPHDIADDGDDGLVYGQQRHRVSMLSLGGGSNRSGHSGAAALAGVGAAAGAVGGGLAASRAANGYGPVNSGSTAYVGNDFALNEKSSRWSGVGGGNGSGGRSKMWKWIVIVGIGVVVVAAIVLGIVFGVVLKNNGGGNSGPARPPSGGAAAGGGFAGQTAAEDTATNGDLNAQSAEIQRLMGNPNLHKVFPGIDYTPLNSQYPECLRSPPSQNNVTRDVAMLSQLTNTIRLYGTDCNQTQMVIHAVQQLGLSGVKIWLGVWQDANKTTNARQLQQMWDILDVYGAAPFKGLIVANEILFRQQMTLWELGQLLETVRRNLTTRGISLPVATSDLGDKWDANLAAQSDYIMANIHPFFMGTPAAKAAADTHTFWTNKAQSFWKADKSKNVIAEVGWPTQGGNHCGQGARPDAVCPDKAVASIEGVNRLMEDFVCQSLADGTNYFWFEAFDEPWKVMFNNGTQNWEDQWGLIDVNRNLKPGIKIPDCGGKTVGPA